jgi:hypothetical protein
MTLLQRLQSTGEYKTMPHVGDEDDIATIRRNLRDAERHHAQATALWWACFALSVLAACVLLGRLVVQ